MAVRDPATGIAVAAQEVGRARTLAIRHATQHRVSARAAKLLIMLADADKYKGIDGTISLYFLIR